MHDSDKLVAVTIALSAAFSGCIGTTPGSESVNATALKSSSTPSSAAPNKPPTIDVFSACGLPETRSVGVARPTGKPGNLTVLDWAGFDSAVSWSYDDGQPSHIEHYPELQATGVRQTFYVNSGLTHDADFDATWTQAVRDGHELGNHTAHHCHADGKGCLFGEYAGSIGAELDQCSAYLTQHYPQKAIWTAAAPFGDAGFDSDTHARFFINRGVKSGTIGPNDSTDPSELPCHMAAANESADSFNRVILDTRNSGKWVIMLIHTINPTKAKWYNPVDIGAITESIAATKELGGVWQDSVVNVGAYWAGQKTFGAATIKHEGSQQTWSWSLPKNFPTGKCLRATVDGGVLTQNGKELAWNEHGYYEISLDAGALSLAAQ